MTTTTLLTCLAAVTALALTPGLDTVLVIRSSGRGGTINGIATALGICLGLFVHASLSALGLSVLLLHTAWAWTLLKYAGAAWLIYLGAGSLREARRGGASSFAGEEATPCAPWRSLRDGFLCNVLNPKVIVFYLAFLPQFIDPQGPLFTQSLVVALLHFTVTLLYFTLLAFTVDRARSFLAREKVNKAFNAISGGVLLLFGINLLCRE